MVGYVKDSTAVVDEMFQTDELSRYLARMNLAPQWEEGVFDRLTAGEVPGEELGQPQKGCRIWQLRKDVDVTMRFIGYEDLVKKFGEPDADNYTQVFDGDLGTNDLERIYAICRDSPPPGYQGYRMALSDVVELYDASGSEFLLLRPGGLPPHPVQPKSGADRMYRNDHVGRTMGNRPAFALPGRGRSPPALGSLRPNLHHQTIHKHPKFIYL